MGKFAERLREVRTNKGILQADLAKKLNVKPNTVSSWEIGAREPSLDMVAQIATALGVPAGYLIGSEN